MKELLRPKSLFRLALVEGKWTVFFVEIMLTLLLLVNEVDSLYFTNV